MALVALLSLLSLSIGALGAAEESPAGPPWILTLADVTVKGSTGQVNGIERNKSAGAAGSQGSGHTSGGASVARRELTGHLSGFKYTDGLADRDLGKGFSYGNRGSGRDSEGGGGVSVGGKATLLSPSPPAATLSLCAPEDAGGTPVDSGVYDEVDEDDSDGGGSGGADDGDDIAPWSGDGQGVFLIPAPVGAPVVAPAPSPEDDLLWTVGAGTVGQRWGDVGEAPPGGVAKGSAGSFQEYQRAKGDSAHAIVKGGESQKEASTPSPPKYSGTEPKGNQNGGYKGSDANGDGKYQNEGSSAARGGTTAATRPRGLYYHGGPVMANPINVYLLMYGRWGWRGCGRRVIATLFRSLTDSSVDKTGANSVYQWWRINTKYTQADGRGVSGQVRIAHIAHDRYSAGKQLAHRGPKSVWSVLQRAIDRERFPADPDGVYFVLTSSDVRVSRGGGGFCRTYCGWHSYKKYKGKRIKFSFVGNAALQCPRTTCNLHLGGRRMRGVPGVTTPNLCYGPDGMASTILHELAEMATNPLLNAWKTRGGVENADLCYRQYRSSLHSVYGSKYNLEGSNGYKYLAQKLFNLRTRKCDLQLA